MPQLPFQISAPQKRSDQFWARLSELALAVAWRSTFSVATTKHPRAASLAESIDPLSTDLVALTRSPIQMLQRIKAVHASMPSWSSSRLQIAELTPDLCEWTYDGGPLAGRQQLCRSRPGLAMLASALSQIPPLQYRLRGDDMVLVELRLSGFEMHSEEIGNDLSLAALTYFPRGTSLQIKLPRVGSLYAFEVFGTLTAIHRQWRLGPAILQALGHSPASLRRCHEVIHKPWQITPAAIELLRDVLSFRHQGTIARACLEARSQQLLCECLTSLSEARPASQLPTRIRDLVHRARSILESDPAKHHTLQSLARSVGLNRTLLAEGFRAEFGQTAFSFLQEERLRRAWSLLEGPQPRIASIATQVGYRDATSFTRAFKAHYGVTPRYVSRSGAR